MPFERALSIEEINQINRQLSAGTHIAILLADDGEYGYFEFGGAFDQLQALLYAWDSNSRGIYLLGRGTTGRHNREGIFIYWKPSGHSDRAEVKIVPINKLLSRGP